MILCVNNIMLVLKGLRVVLVEFFFIFVDR